MIELLRVYSEMDVAGKTGVTVTLCIALAALTIMVGMWWDRGIRRYRAEKGLKDRE